MLHLARVRARISGRLGLRLRGGEGGVALVIRLEDAAAGVEQRRHQLLLARARRVREHRARAARAAHEHLLLRQVAREEQTHLDMAEEEEGR